MKKIIIIIASILVGAILFGVLASVLTKKSGSTGSGDGDKTVWDNIVDTIVDIIDPPTETTTAATGNETQPSGGSGQSSGDNGQQTTPTNYTLNTSHFATNNGSTFDSMSYNFSTFTFNQLGQAEYYSSLGDYSDEYAGDPYVSFNPSYFIAGGHSPTSITISSGTNSLITYNNGNATYDWDFELFSYNHTSNQYEVVEVIDYHNDSATVDLSSLNMQSGDLLYFTATNLGAYFEQDFDPTSQVIVNKASAGINRFNNYDWTITFNYSLNVEFNISHLASTLNGNSWSGISSYADYSLGNFAYNELGTAFNGSDRMFGCAYLKLKPYSFVVNNGLRPTSITISTGTGNTGDTVFAVFEYDYYSNNGYYSSIPLNNGSQTILLSDLNLQNDDYLYFCFPEGSVAFSADSSYMNNPQNLYNGLVYFDNRDFTITFNYVISGGQGSQQV